MTDTDHLWCGSCQTQPTVARLNDRPEGPHLVCHCTHTDGSIAPVLVTELATRPDSWEYRAD